MVIPQFKLFKFQLYKSDDNKPTTTFIVSSDWYSAFNEVYKNYGDDATIVTGELIANENLSLFIDTNYIDSKNNSEKNILGNRNIVITGVNKYDANTF